MSGPGPYFYAVVYATYHQEFPVPVGLRPDAQKVCAVQLQLYAVPQVGHPAVPRKFRQITNLNELCVYVAAAAKGGKGSAHHHAPGSGPHANDRKSKNAKGAGAAKKGAPVAVAAAIPRSYSQQHTEMFHYGGARKAGRYQRTAG